MNKLRGWLYQIARLLGDINAVRRGRIVPRLWNKLLSRKLVSNLWWKR